MPSPAQPISAVIQTGGKQYRVAPGDRILVDRLSAEPGAELTLERVLLVADGDDVKVGIPGVEGITVTARVLGDRRGKKIDVLRYKSKKRVRVHRGARADLTALEIMRVGDKGIQSDAPAKKTARKAADKPATKPAADEAPAKPKRAAAARTEAADAAEATKPARRTRARAAADDNEEATTDGA